MIKWYCRWFKVITTKTAIEWGLKPKINIYGDKINHLNCRSIWTDAKYRAYRVKELIDFDNNNYWKK